MAQSLRFIRNSETGAVEPQVVELTEAEELELATAKAAAAVANFSPTDVLMAALQVIEDQLTLEQQVDYATTIDKVEMQLRYGRYAVAIATLTAFKATLPLNLQPVVDNILAVIPTGA